MDSAGLEQLRFLLAAFRETEIPPATERQLLAEFRRLWPPLSAADKMVGAEPCPTRNGFSAGQPAAP